MHQFIIPPLVKWTLGAVGAAAIVHWVVKEVRRINEELDQAKMVRIPEREIRPMLRRDPMTGEYRPQ